MQTATGTPAFVASASTRSARALAFSRGFIDFFLSERIGTVDRWWSVRDFTQKEPKPVFNIAGVLESAFGQSLDAILSRWPAQRGDARVPTGSKFDVRRQTGVHQPLRLGDRPLVEAGDAGRQCIHISVEFGVRQGAIDVTIGLCL